jgi:hypothetical protein
MSPYRAPEPEPEPDLRCRTCGRCPVTDPECSHAGKWPVSAFGGDVEVPTSQTGLLASVTTFLGSFF